MRRIRESLITPEELNLARDSIVRSLPSEFETTTRVTASAASLYIYDLGLDYYTKLPARLEAVTADHVRAAAMKYLVPDTLLVVAVGDRARIGAELAKLKLGGLEMRNADGAPLLTARPSQ